MPKNYLKHIENLSKDVGELLKFKDLLIGALNSSSEGMALLDKEGKYIWLNKAHAEMFGYEYHELVGQSWEVLYKKSDVSFFYENAFPALEKFGEWNGQTKGICKDSTIVVNEHVYLTSLKDGGIICICIKI